MARKNKLDRSLDDIIKQQRKRRWCNGCGGEAAPRGVSGGQGSYGKLRGSHRGFGGALRMPRGASGGGIQKRRGVSQTAYTRVEDNWLRNFIRVEVFKATGDSTRDITRDNTGYITRDNTGYITRDNGRQGKLLISNLHFHVNYLDIQELFTEIGPVQRAAVHYDCTGWPLGTAEVIFDMRADALQALQQYNNVLLDGRPLKIELVDQGWAQTSARPGFSGHVPGGQGYVRQGNQSGRKRGRGRWQGPGWWAGRGRGWWAGRVQLTREQLDAQLDAYMVGTIICLQTLMASTC